MTDIESWLNSLGLEKYISTFVEAEIDLLALPHLTDEDLIELGLPLGPRRKIGNAIKLLDDGLHSPSAETTDASDANDSTNPVAASHEAERRHLTVMFVDLVGSTEMASKVDAEEFREIITRYQDTVAGVIARYEGFIAQFMGDGVLCYFGWPRANEDDAERAVRAGLAIIAGVQELSGPENITLSTRVGIASGIVVIGDLIGSGASQEAAVVGETPNLAARLQGLAQPNQLVLPSDTRNLLSNIFDLESLGAHELKGIAQPVDAYAVIGEGARESRFAARQTGKLAPMYGREQELGLIRERWAKVKSGHGQMIVISGEAGIGKSRITRALLDEIAAEDHTRITCQCSPYHTDSAFYPIIQQINYAAGIQLTDNFSTRLDKLERVAGVDQDNAALVAALIGIDGTQRYGRLDLTPAQQRARTMVALTQLITRPAADKPLVFVFEDMHWIDPTSLELVEITLDAITDKNVLILATARPTFDHGFGGHPLVTRYALNRLGQDQTLSIVEKLTGGKALPPEVLRIITNRTDGVPLFVEELTKTVLETGVLKEDEGKLVLNGPLDALAIPSTLHDSLMARLDRLQPIKEVAQTASCIGRGFEHRLLAAISPLSEDELETALLGLIKAELVYRRGVPPEATYLFKHALVRDAAYESLLKDRRRKIHRRILQHLETSGEAAPEVLAYHAESAGMTDRAIDLWEAASKAALAHPAYDEAISNLKRAIELISPQVENGNKSITERALALQLQLGPALFAHKGYGSDETNSAFEYALQLADSVGETPMRYSVLYGLWVGKHVRGEHAEALQQAEALLKLANSVTETAPLLLASRLVGISLSFQGRFTEAQPHLERAHSLFDPAIHRGMENRFGQDPGVGSNCYLMLNHWFLGETQQSHVLAKEAELAALETGHINTICYMHVHMIIHACLAKDKPEMERHIAAMVPIVSEHNLVQWRHFENIGRALLATSNGDSTGITQFLQTDAQLIASNSRLFVAYFRIETGFHALAMGLLDKAQELASMANSLINKTGETFALAELHRLEGALALEIDDQHAAEVALKKAIAVAHEQSSKSWELRAATDLARLWCSTNRTQEAQALLTPVHDSIADGNCTEFRYIAHEMLAK